ncbi:NIPSNAP protein [Thalassospira xiamenensis]|uniref:NIPSNAP protein n=1 Tax=Thalassospira xiamenensis TaxID=220697 RepID=A0A285RSD2_9PROT|nr:NIPSNAP protein [Thalassospira xiamenensis]
MITCYLKYIVDMHKIPEFEDYARRWIPIVNRMGGTHHGYFLPHEGASNIAYALFSFPSLAHTKITETAWQMMTSVLRHSNLKNVTAASSVTNAVSCARFLIRQAYPIMPLWCSCAMLHAEIVT